MNRSEGIVLSRLEFKENNRILKVFTKNEGLLNLIVKRLNKKNTALLNITSPLTHIDFIYKPSKSDLKQFLEGSIVNSHLTIRKSYDHIQAAQKILKTIELTQAHEKTAPNLFTLLSLFLNKLPLTDTPYTLQSSFLLKLLQYESLIHLEKICSNCQKQDALCLNLGESLCLSCKGPYAFTFSNKEWDILLKLCYLTSFQAIESLFISEKLKEKIVFLTDRLLTH